MEIEEYERVAAAEDDHWWYRNTRALVADLLEPWLAGRGHLRVLDAGCGPGGNGAWLASYGTVVGVDRSDDALELVRTRRPEILPARGDLRALPIASAVVDVVTAITVLHAVDDDAAAMRELARVLAPSGVLVVVEPAFASLRRTHDATVHGQRRYRRAHLAALAERAGLQVRRTTYAYSFLAPPAAALAALDRRAHGRPNHGTASDVERRSLDRVFAPLARAERRLLTHVDLPAGTSAIVVATAPGG